MTGAAGMLGHDVMRAGKHSGHELVLVLLDRLLARMHHAQHARSGMAVELDLEPLEARVFAHLRFVQYLQGH